MKKHLLLPAFLLFSQLSFSQNINCDNAFPFLEEKEKEIAEINTKDPELIPLHHLFLQDIKEDLNRFDSLFIPSLHDCISLDYYSVVARYDQVAYLHQLKMDTMQLVRPKVDSLFYEQAQLQLRFENRENAIYLLNRALQYNRTYPDALILKCELIFEENDYERCLEILQLLYHESKLEERHENQLIHFTMRFYEKLYETADSLVKVDLASDALYLFKILEQFCVNMPTTYCNDDYYHGILRSKKGVYESYLLIAEVAKERGSPEIAKKFLAYAEQYRIENENDIINSENARELPEESHLQIPEKEMQNYYTYIHEVEEERVGGTEVIEVKEGREVREVREVREREEGKEVKEVREVKESGEIDIIREVQNINTIQKVNDTLEVNETLDIDENLNVDGNLNVDSVVEIRLLEEIKESYEIEIVAEVDSTDTLIKQYTAEEIAEMEIEYNRLFVEAITQCLDNRFSEAFKTLKRALELEACDCFEIDPRIRVLYDSIAETK